MIWTQEQLFDQIKDGYKNVNDAEGKAQPEQIAQAKIQLETMETWLDTEFRNKIDEILNRT